MIVTAGKFKETQVSYLLTTIINIVLSISLVFSFSIIGIAIGTLSAMLFHFTWEFIYVNSKILGRSNWFTFKVIIIDILTVLICFPSTYFIPMITDDYLGWILLAFENAGIYIFVLVFLNLIIFRKVMLTFFQKK